MARFIIPAMPGGSYDFAHSDAFLGLHFAKGLAACGHDPVVVWGGETGLVQDIQHAAFEDVYPNDSDILLTPFTDLGIQILSRKEWPRLLIPSRRWLYAFSYSSAHAPVYREFDRIFVESRTGAEAIRGAVPSSTQVQWLMAGVADSADLSKTSPYPPGTRNLFYAGRLIRSGADSSILLFKQLLEQLGDGWHLWYATNTLQLPPAPKGFAQRWGGKLCYTASNAIWGHRWEKGGVLWLDKEMFRIVADQVFDHPNAHCLGPLGYGTFWHWLHHADCYLDHGFPPGQGPSPINCKIMDPLRAGCSIIADGTSASYYLIGQYNAGTVVPYLDSTAMTRAIQTTSALALPSEQRKERAETVRSNESWTQRVRQMLDGVQL